MGVNKALRACAAPILYGKNTWVISDEFDVSHRNHMENWIQPWSYLRHVRLPFDYRTYNASRMLHISRNAFGTNHGHLTPAARAKMIHDERCNEAWTMWRDRLLEVISCSPNGPASLLLDFCSAYCPSGCCREVESVILDLMELEEESDWFTIESHVQISAVGLLSEDEEKILHQVHAYRCDQCVGPKDKRQRISCKDGL